MVNKRGIGGRTDSNVQRRFWIGFLTVLLLSTAIIIIETPSITGGASIQIISYLKEGSSFNAEIRNVENVKSFTTKIIKDTKNSKIYFEDIDSVSWNFQGVVLSMFKITSEDEENYGSFEIDLKIKESDLKRLAPSELKLYHNGIELETDPGLREGDYIHFKTRSEGFGEFLIGKIEKIEMVKEEPKQKLIDQPSVIESIQDQPTIQEPKKQGFFTRIINSIKNFLRIK